MTDSFLAAHWAAPRVYDISAIVSPISIRDQMMRGRLIADRVITAELVSDQRDEGLVVIGGGAAGLTAALRAAGRGIPTLVLERAPHLFPLQRGCTTRWIDPTQYDWPMGHWPKAVFPYDGLDMELPWSADRADQVAEQWSDAVKIFRATPAGSRLTIETSANAVSVAWKSALHGVPVTYQARGSAPTVIAGAVVVAAGFGAENVTVGTQFSSFGFWEDDPFEQPNLGLPASVRPEVLISGAGDGALQDLMRIMTGQRSARQVLSSCGLSAAQFDALHDLVRAAVHGMYWGQNKKDDHEWHRKLDEACRERARIEIRNSMLKAGIAVLTRHAPRKISLVHECDHLTPVYLLNRFVAHLLNEFWVQTQDQPLFAPQKRLNAVIATHHGARCDPKKPADCFGKPHGVRITSLLDCRDPVESTSGALSAWNVIVARHGLGKAAQLIEDATPLGHTRHILPFYLL